MAARSTPTRRPSPAGSPGTSAPHAAAALSASGASRPTASSLKASGATPSRGSAPRVGRRPTTPQWEAGTRTEPLVSVPSASATMPAATATADPPLDPPAIRVGSCGLCTPGVIMPSASSCVAVLPMITAPAATRASTTSALRSATRSSGRAAPRRVGRPATSMTSLIATGRPCSGPRERPAVELLLGLPGLRQRELRRELDERAQLGLQRLRTLERGLRARHRPGGQGHGGGSMTGSASGACAAAAATSSAARCSRRW